jgi:Na+/proline symporter
VNVLDYVILLGTMLGIAAYGMWRTRGRRDLKTYLKGDGTTRWIVIGLSVMATQASAITFLSTPGQGYNDGLGFVQNYFGAPFALIFIAVVFLPIYRRLNVYTSYEYLGKRFDGKTRLLGVALFLLQRGLGAGITIYAPAIVLSTVMGWRLDLTILFSGVLVIVYTVMGGTAAVTVTQKYQIGIIFTGMIAAFVVLLMKLPRGLTFSDSLALAGGFHKLKAVDFSPNIHRRYTFWSGLLGGVFLQLSYFGTDQSQVQRYLSGASLRESRLGLMFNAVLKIPMQFFILLLGTMLFVFYQFQPPPVYFNQAAWKSEVQRSPQSPLKNIEQEYSAAYSTKKQLVQQWVDARHTGDARAQSEARDMALAAQQSADAIRDRARTALIASNPRASKNDADYMFITFILDYLPHGLIGLLVAVFFAAALSAKAAELNALGSTSTVDIYRHVINRDATDAHYLAASKWFTVFWGLVALMVALFANLVENLIQATNILGSIFYGVVLGLFLIAFFLKHIGGTAVFWAAIAAQALVLVFYFTLPIAYLWYNAIGPAACILFALALQPLVGGAKESNVGALPVAPAVADPRGEELSC